MKNSIVRLIAIILCAVVITGLVTILFLRRPDAAAPPTATDEAEETPAYSALPGNTVMIEFADGRKVLANEYLNYVLNRKSMYESVYGSTLWVMDPMAGTYVLAMVDHDVISLYAAEDLGAVRGFQLSEADRKMVEDDIASIYAEVGEEEFIARLETMGMTVEDYRTFQTRWLYATGVNEDYLINDVEITDDMVDQYIADNYMGAKHIFLSVSEEADEEGVEEVRAKAESILQRLRDGEDFDTLREEFTEDRDTENNINMPEGYTFNDESGFIPVFITTTQSLAVGEISEVVENTDSYHSFHIIMRIPPVREQVFDEIKRAMESNAFSDVLQPYIDALDAQFTEARNNFLITDTIAGI